MATGLQSWSTTAASNNTADSSVNWSEGQAPSTVNDSARAEMASAAKWRDDNNGTLSTTGSSAAFTVTSNQGSTGNIDGQTITVQLHATADTSATLAKDGNTAAAIQLYAGTNLAGSELVSGSVHRFRYASASTAWIKEGHETVVAGNIPAGAVTYSRIQTESDNTALLNVQGAAWPPQEVVIGTGLVLSTTSTSTSQAAWTTTTTSTAIPFTISAPAFPPTSAYKKLSIKVATTTTVTGAADYVTLSSGSAFKTIPLSGTINMGTAGAVNALDAGTLATGTWYAIYGIGTSTSTTGGFLASTSFTTPLLPSGYTYSARVGAVVTSTSTSGTALMGTWQFGRKAQYIVGLGNTTNPVQMASGNVGSISTPTFTSITVTGYVPTTASVIEVGAYAGSGVTVVAPSTSFGAYSSLTNPPPIISGNTSVGNIKASLLLEGAAIYWASNSSNSSVYCFGWEDNL